MTAITGQYKFALETIARLETRISELESERGSYARLQIEKDRERVKEGLDLNDTGLKRYLLSKIDQTPIQLD